ncbi:hypothetical protein N7E81_10140 [Reichenbachiella carrageenanivorans]|uniref:Uncharacterized protein n=1 Tax=Reichenbachiella carrageenanivorans TaxID=2979869 RepID=A0ABY6CY03_9BACT|nr:hypothetical protein [Reichenbachiella carrageenanivorans]UXX77728.1 hypothetical protein N7E81_10140 [Reichenbachiella carrageenanivorans]
MIDLQFQYSPIVNLKVSHEYFQSNAAENLQFVPTAKTLNTLSSFDLLFRSNHEGFHVLVDQASKDRWLELLRDKKQLSFGFWIGDTSPYFSSITEEASPSPDQLFYFKNLKESIGVSAPMHKGDFVSKNEMTSVMNANFKWDNIKEGQEMSIIDSNRIVRLTGEKAALEAAVSGLPEGYYEVEDKSGSIQSHFLVLPFTKPKYLIGFLEITLDESIIAQITDAIIEGSPIPKLDFFVVFKARQAYWRYVLVSQYVQGLEKSKLEAEQSDIVFSGPTPVRLANGGAAVEFLSQKPLRITKYSDLSFRLSAKKKGSGDDAERILVKRMPLPRIDSIVEDRINQKFIAEIFINI